MVTDKPSGLERTVFQKRSSGDGSDDSSLSYEDMNAELANVQNFLFLIAGPTASGKTTVQIDIMKLVGSINEVKIEQTREIRDVLDVGRVQITKQEYRDNCKAERYLVTNTTQYPDDQSKREYVSYGIPKGPFLENLLSQDAILTMTDPKFYKCFIKRMKKNLDRQRVIPIAIITDDRDDLQMRLDARDCSESERLRRLLQAEPQWEFYASRICQGEFPHIIVNNSPKSLRECQKGEKPSPIIRAETYAAINQTVKKTTEIVKFYRELRNNPMSAMQHDNAAVFDVNRAFLNYISFKFFGCCYDKVVEGCNNGNLKLNKSGERLTEIKQKTKNTTLVDHLFEHMTVSEAEADKQTGVLSIEFNDVISGAPHEDIQEIFRCIAPDYGRIIGNKIRYSISDKPSFDKRPYLCAIEMKIY